MRFPLSWIREFAALPEDIDLLRKGYTFSGTEVDEVILENGDTIFDFGFTVNRPDLMSIFGLAREASSIFDLKYPSYMAGVKATGAPIENDISIEIRDPSLCPRYRALLIRGVKVGESSPKIKNRLLACGLRPINSVVDATNYVLLEYGHPLHAFDMSRVKGNKIIIRSASPGEKILMLDGVERKLESGMLVIADGVRPLVVAGVMGGDDAGVTFTTRDILLEGAVFDPSSVRRTSKSLGVHTDASHRFERGTDFNGPVLALERAAGIIMELCGGRLAEGFIDLIPEIPANNQVRFRSQRLNRVLGLDVKEEDALSVLKSLGFIPEKVKDGEFIVAVPSFRVDVSREIDLIEEIIRIYGLDKLPSRIPQGIDTESGRNRTVAIEDEVKKRLASKGLSEAIHLSMTDPALDSLFSPGKEPVKISNPLSEANSVLRQSLLPNLLLTAKRNSSYGQKSIGMFEAGHIYFREPDGGASEEGRLAVLFSEDDAPKVFNQALPRDIMSLKGIIENLFDSFNIPVEFRQTEPSNSIFSKDHYLNIVCGEKEAGFLSYLEPQALKQLDIKSKVAAAEISLSVFSDRKEPSFEPFSRFPASKRDISVIVSKDIPWGQIENVVSAQEIKELSKIELIEIYEDNKIGGENKSVTFSLYFQSLTRTLSDNEVEENVKKVLTALKDSFGAFLRQE